MARKQQKAGKSPEKSLRDRIIDGALSLAAVQGWESCSVRDIAGEAEVTLEEFYEHFDDRTDVIAAYGRRLDRAVLSRFADLDYDASPRDRLFDILMERFDAASEHRDGIVSVLRAGKVDPKQAVIGLPHLGGSMARMLEAAGLETGGLRGAARVAGLAALYLWVLRIWIDDESEDLSKTMAALDKGLGRLESAANSLGL